MRISDWSSDVCSSDLIIDDMEDLLQLTQHEFSLAGPCLHDPIADTVKPGCQNSQRCPEFVADTGGNLGSLTLAGVDGLRHGIEAEIGRASCRERVCQYV